MRCAAKTAAGGQCKQNAMAGTDLCVSHLRRAGRKTRLTVELTDELVSMLQAGVPLKTALAAVNVPPSTYYDWRSSESPIAVRFGERVDEARARGEALLVTHIRTAAPALWQAAAWLLERTVPETYSRPSQRGLVESPDKPADPFAEFVDDELAARRADKA